jgi:hypothetical protein
MRRRRRGSDYERNELDELTDLFGMNQELDPETGEWSVATKNGLTHLEAVEKYSERTKRLNAVAGIYQRANRIITGEPITVTVIKDKDLDTNARSNGKDIELNELLIEELTDESILSLNGVNYHELAHVMFSPRSGSNLGIYVRDNKLFRALSVLEEARAEHLLITKYPAVRPYLEASLYTYLLADSSRNWGGVFHLVTGRTYLPLELRQAITDKAIASYGLDIVSEVHSCIHEYRTLSFPRDFDKAKELAHRLSAIVGRDEDKNLPSSSKDLNKLGEGTEPKCVLPSKGRPANGKEQEALQGNASKDKTETLSSPKQTNLEVGSSVGDSEGISIETPDIEQDSDDVAISKALNDRMNSIKDDSNVKRDIRDTRKAIMDSDETRTAIKATKSISDREPSEGAITIAKRFSTELERLVRNNDPAWLSRVRSGKLNISRTMNPDVNAIAEAFDQWDIGNEATDIEAVILTDNSGSMGGLMKSVCESTWIIKRGIESINGAVTVYSFDDDTDLMYDKTEKAKPRMMKYTGSTGGTNPLRGIIEAGRVLETSKRAIKILFIVTDGEWLKEAECDNLIKSMGDKGVLTSVVFIGNYKDYKQLVDDSKSGIKTATETLQKLRHKAKVFHAVSNTRDLIDVATTLVKSTLKKGR